MKIILSDIRPEDFYFAGRTASYLLAEPTRRDAIIEFGEEHEKRTFYAHRTKASNISVREIQ